MKILIPICTGLGNMILKTPMIKIMKAIYPEAQIILLADNRWGVECVLQNSNLIDAIINWPLNGSYIDRFKVLWLLRRGEFDAILCPFDATPRFLKNMLWFLPAKIKICHVPILSQLPTLSWKSKLYLIKLIFFSKIKAVPILPGRHEIDLNIDLVEALVCKPIERDYSTFINTTLDQQVIVQYDLVPRNYIVIQISAAAGVPTPKIWPLSYFKELILLIEKNHPKFKVVIVGDKSEAERAAKLQQDVSVVNLVGRTNFDEIANVINFAQVAICHDSGLMHMASALQTNLVALYGPTDFTRTRPLNDNCKLLFSKNEAFAQMYGFAKTERQLSDMYPDETAMADLSVSEVYRAVGQFLELNSEDKCDSDRC